MTNFSHHLTDGGSPPCGGLAPGIRKWMERFACAVRERNFEAGKSLCVQNIHAFGTVCNRAQSLAELDERQWHHVWPSTRDFDFDYESARCDCEGALAIVTATWASCGDGSAEYPLRRHGRATLALREMGGAWLATHTHFSLDPESLRS